MRKRLAAKVINNEFRALEWNNPITRRAIKRISKIKRLLQVDRPEIGSVFLDHDSRSPYGCWLLLGKKLNDCAVPGYHFRTPYECVDEIIERCSFFRDAKTCLQHKIIVAYSHTGRFNKRGAELLKFHHVVGPADKLSRRIAA